MKSSAALVSDQAGYESTANVSTDECDRRLGWYVAIVGMVAVFISFVVFQAALPENAVDDSVPHFRESVRRFVPEGWAFFTLSPRSPFPRVYRLESAGRWRNVTPGPIADPNYAMGLDRAGRSQGPEVGLLLTGVPKDGWRKCIGDPVSCLSKASAGVTVANTSRRTICGDIGIVVQDVLPWAWRNLHTQMPSKVTRMRVTC